MSFNLRDQLNIYNRSELYQFVLADGQAITVIGVSAMGDIPAELWYFDANSTATDNGTTVIQPTAIPFGVSGRYLLHMVQADWGSISNKPTLFSGSYNDLTDKPTIPGGQVQSDWNATVGLGVIANKPTLFSGNYSDLTGKPTIPTNTNQLTNGAGFLTSVPAQTWASITGKPAFKKQETFSGTTNGSGQYTVTFGTAYSVAPNIQANIIGATDSQIIKMTVSTTGFTVTVRNRVDVIGLLPTWGNVTGANVDVLITEK